MYMKYSDDEVQCTSTCYKHPPPQEEILYMLIHKRTQCTYMYMYIYTCTVGTCSCIMYMYMCCIIK